jgi:putative hydrolase of the HAD superfamily
VDTARPLEETIDHIAATLPLWPKAPAPLGWTRDAPIAAVTFDCWNTLLYEADWHLAHARRVEALHSAACEGGQNITRETAGVAFDAAWRKHMAQWHEGVASGAPEIALWAMTALALEPSGASYDHLVARWQEASHSGRVIPLPHARRTLAAVHESGIATALICDTGLTPGRVVRQHLERHGLLELLDVQIFSDEEGVPKPAAPMFRTALDALAVDAARSVHVGDLKRTDVAGAHGVGMRAIRITSRHDDTTELPEADAVVSSHIELRGLLLQRPAR